MAKIKMLKTAPGSPDGIHVLKYQANAEYDIPDRLAGTFVSLRVAVYVPPPVIKPPETQLIESAPEKKEVFEEFAGEDDVDEEEEIELHELLGSDNNAKDKKIMRVFQLAKELGKPSKKIIKVANKLGISVAASSSGLSEEDVERIKETIDK